MAFDNKEDRVYAAGSTMTTCELADPHYHFASRQVKWVNKRLMVARPAVLYVEDVPIAWLPFGFQDTRHGRPSGILAPGFGTIDSRVNYSTRFDWGMLNIGGSRTQSLNSAQVTATVPTVSFSPNPIAISHDVTWSPSFSFSNSIVQNGGGRIGIAVGPGLFDSVLTNSRSSSISVGTPLRVGKWNLQSSMTVLDEWSSARTTVVDTAAHTVTTQSERFQTGVDWSAGIGLPVAVQGR